MESVFSCGLRCAQTAAAPHGGGGGGGAGQKTELKPQPAYYITANLYVMINRNVFILLPSVIH